MMKYRFIVLVIIFASFAGCKKSDSSKYSGTVTIDNQLYGTGPYYAFGFSFPLAEKISTLSDPPPDITITNDGTLDNLILQTNNYEDSFALVDEYSSAAEAKTAFDKLVSPETPSWAVWADYLEPNQIWLYKSGTDHYAKIRIISIVSELRNDRTYAECTFEWVYQPDGSFTFPGK
jgi:hypothetical protein